MGLNKIAFTESDQGGSGVGQTITEASMQTLMKYSGGSIQNGVINGLASSIGTGLTVDVTAGRAIVEGYLVDLTAETVTVNASETTAVWFIQLTVDGNGDVDGWQWARVIDADLDGQEDPARSVRIFGSDSNGSSVTAVGDRRFQSNSLGTFIVGGYAGDDAADRTIVCSGPTGDSFQPSFVIVQGIASPYILGLSTIMPNISLSQTGYYFNDTIGSLASTTGRDHRPEIVATGFKVGQLAAGDLNNSGTNYRYIAFR